MSDVAISKATAADLDIVEALLQREQLPLDGLRRADLVLTAIVMRKFLTSTT